MGKERNLIILGGTGFVGEYLVRELSRSGKNRICAVYYSPLSARERIAGVKYRRLDLRHPGSRLAMLLRDADVLVLLTQPDRLMTGNVLKALAGSKRLKKIVFVSTILVYSDRRSPQNENSVPKPVTDYEIGKLEEEKLYTEFARDRGLKLVITRLANVYGDIKNRGIVSHMLHALISSKPLTVNDKGGQIRDYIYVEDAARLLHLVIDHDQKCKFEIINICSGKGISVMDLLMRIERIARSHIDFNHGPAIKEKRSVIGDDAKFRRTFRRSVKYAIDAGLEKAYKNYLSQSRNA